MPLLRLTVHDLGLMVSGHGIEPEGETGTFVAMGVCSSSGNTTCSVTGHSSPVGDTVRLLALDTNEEKGK